MAVFRNALRQFFQYPVDLCFLIKLQLAQLVIQINNGLRFDEQRRACAALIMDYTRYPVPVLLFDRYNVPAVPHRDYRILKYGFIVGQIQYMVHLSLQCFVLPDYGSSDAPQLRTCIVCHLVFGNDTSVYLSSQILMDCDQLCHRTYHRDLRYLAFQECNDPLSGLHVVQYPQQLSHGQYAAFPGK